MRILTSIACCSLLAITGALAKPGASGKPGTAEIPKAIPVTIPIATAKLYVKSSAKNPAAVKAKASGQAAARKAPYQDVGWQIQPKCEDRGKEDPTYGFLLKHSF